MRTLQYFFILIAIVGALAFLAPYVDSEPVRVEFDSACESFQGREIEKAGREFFGPLRSHRWRSRSSRRNGSFLHRDNRRYCKATLIEGAKNLQAVALKLKGSAGSFQGPEGKPGLTINFDYYKRGGGVSTD
jgi:hypothetical protein